MGNTANYEELELSSKRDEKKFSDDGDREKHKLQKDDDSANSHENEPKSIPRSSSVAPEDAPVSLPSDSCDYMDLECEIEPFDDESLTPIPPPETTADPQPNKTTAVVAPTGFKKRKASGGDKKKEMNKNKIQKTATPCLNNPG